MTSAVALELADDPSPSVSCEPEEAPVVLDDDVKNPTESETEDEEVKLNCFGGVRESRDSDMDTLGEQLDEDASLADDEQEIDGLGEQEGIVHFVKCHWENSHSDTPPLLKPKPVVSKSPIATSSITNEPTGGEADGQDDGSIQHYSDAGDKSVESMEEAEYDQEPIEVLQDSSISDHGGIDFDNNDCEPSFIELLTEMEQDVVKDQKSRTISFDTDPWNFESAPSAFPRTHKRVRSRNSLVCQSEVNGDRTGSPKRFCGPLPCLSAVGLGQLQPGAIDATILPLRHRSPFFSSEEDEDEVDRRLGEELLQKLKGDDINRDEQLSPPPVPLLTPPQSPLTIPGEGGTATLCEWPSNIAVDLALREATDLRPMTPESLQQFEYDEEARVASQKSGPNTEVCILTPLLQGIYVGLD